MKISIVNPPKSSLTPKNFGGRLSHEEIMQVKVNTKGLPQHFDAIFSAPQQSSVQTALITRQEISKSLGEGIISHPLSSATMRILPNLGSYSSTPDKTIVKRSFQQVISEMEVNHYDESILFTDSHWTEVLFEIIQLPLSILKVDGYNFHQIVYKNGFWELADEASMKFFDFNLPVTQNLVRVNS
ncbi:MAG: hypothetical protein ACW98K_10605 [Candidatus Kariarchaeaceae archaeon]|jgi:hypothetical protein